MILPLQTHFDGKPNPHKDRRVQLPTAGDFSWSTAGGRSGGARGKADKGGKRDRETKEVFDSFQNRSKNFSPKTGKFLIPIKYRNCYFFSVS